MTVVMGTTNHKPACYVASPYGFAESTRHWYYDALLPTLERYVAILDPWKEDTSHILTARPEERPALWTALGEKHLKTIAEKAQLIVAGLDQEPPDVGTCIEVGHAAAFNIPIIGYRSDLRTSGEEGLPYNLMIAASIKQTAGIAVSNLDDLEAAVADYAHRISLGKLSRIYPL